MKRINIHFPFELSQEQYARLFAPWMKYSWGRRALSIANLVCASIFYIAYPICILLLWIGEDPRLAKALLIPALSFVLLSVIRKLINRPRPYEAWGFAPLLRKESKGVSFPSRHIFSAFIIAATVAYITPWGHLLLIPALLLATIRVIGGVHYPSDVTAGAIFAGLAALLYLL